MRELWAMRLRPDSQEGQFAVYLRACTILAIRAISHRLHRHLGRPQRPKAITVTITRRCNSRCLMCNIWRLGLKQEELTLEDLTRFLSSPGFSSLVELDLTGGEPFLRKDLPELTLRIVQLAKKNLKSLKTLALATNGLLPRLVQRVVGEMLSAINGKFDLALVCSMDGIGEIHDRIRGVPGAYRRVRETLDRLGEYTSGRFPFRLGIKSTILPQNWEELDGLIQFARDQGLFHILSPVLFTRERFRNLEAQAQLSLLPGYRQGLIDLYSRKDLRDLYYSWVMVDTLKKGRRRNLCTAALDHFFVEGDGRIFPCPLLDIPLGNIQTHSLEDVLDSSLRKEIAKQAGYREECHICLEPGCIRFSQAGEGLNFLRFILEKKGRERFRQAYWIEGLSKYF